MAGILKVDQVQSDSNLAFAIAGSNVAFMNATSLQMVGSNVSLAGTNVITNGKIVTAAQPTGSVLQVVSAIKTDTFSFSVTARTWTSVTGLSAAITPSSTSNKVLVTAVVSISATNTYNAMGGRITRNGSVVAVGDTAGSRASAFFGSDDWLSAAGANQGQIYISFLDSPSTTSATTYQLQLINDRDTETIYVNRGQYDGDTSQTFRNASSITVMEIAG
jgi:hypothetical protein